MAHLGDLTAAVREAEAPTEETKFTWHERDFRVVAEPSGMGLLKFGWAAAADLDNEDPRGLAAMYDYIRSVIVAEDWPAFEERALQVNASTDELLDLAGKLLESMSDRPTQAASDSPHPQQPTSPNSKTEPGSDSAEARRRALGLVPVSELLAAANAG